MKFIQLILPLVLLGLFSLKLTLSQPESTTVDPDLSYYDSSTDSYITPEESSDSTSEYGGSKRFSGNLRYTAVRRIRKSGAGSGTSVGNRRGNRNANRSRNRRGNRNGNRNRNRRGIGTVNRNKKRQAAKGRRSNGKRRAYNHRGASVIRLG